MAFTARFDGVCPICNVSYNAGDTIARVGYKKYGHTHCKANNRFSGSNGNGHTEKTPPPPPPPPPATSTVPEDIAQTVYRLLEGAELAVDEAQVTSLVQKELDVRGVKQQVEIVVKVGERETVKIEGKVHAEFEWMLSLAAERQNILMVGPAGCGKTYIAQQLAKALGLSFGFISCSAGMSEGQLLGRLLPIGEGGRFEYVRSEFVRCYEEGGVFLIDEVDAADANTLIILNAALANGHMAVPNRPENPVAKRHPDFICVAAANTWGTGADRQYVGRNQLDEATLDRFRIGQVEMDYDADVEASLCRDAELLEHLRSIRRKVQENKIRRLVSMRFFEQAYTMKKAGAPLARIEKALFAGWTRDELAKVGR